MSSSQSIYIDAPVEKVFDWFKDPRNVLKLNPDWARREEITDVHVTPEGRGTFHVWAVKLLPRVRYEYFAVRTGFVPNKCIVDRFSLAAYGTYTYTFEIEGAGTRVRLQRHPRSFWRLWLLDKLVDQLETRSDERFLGTLKTFMESAGAPARVAG